MDTKYSDETLNPSKTLIFQSITKANEKRQEDAKD